MLNLARHRLLKGTPTHSINGSIPLTLPHPLSFTFATTSKQQRKMPKKVELTSEPPTPWPPINPKVADYEKQKGKRPPKKEGFDGGINVGFLFLAAGTFCGAIMTMFQPKDFRNDFNFYGPFPDAYFTKLARDQPLNVRDTVNNKMEIERDHANSTVFALFLGFAGGTAGHFWFKQWSHPLRLPNLSTFELCGQIKELRVNYLRNCLKGTFYGTAAVMAAIYGSVFMSYLWIGSFYSNKYVDRSFWEFLELQYTKNVEGRKEYELNLELQERWKERHQVWDEPLAPSINVKADGKAESEAAQRRIAEFEGDVAERKDKNLERKTLRRERFKKAIKGMEWNTESYLKWSDTSYYKLEEAHKAERWNMAREMAMLSCSCAAYIVLPVFFAANVFSTRMYHQFWRRCMEHMIKHKQRPDRLY